MERSRTRTNHRWQRFDRYRRAIQTDIARFCNPIRLSDRFDNHSPAAGHSELTFSSRLTGAAKLR
jgi:hypothetical protein